MQHVKVSRKVKAKPEAIYRAFTSDVAFREWLCDGAWVQGREGGKLFLNWNSGYSAIGTYTVLEPKKKIVFTWHGLGEPAPTHVQVEIEDAGDGHSRIDLLHGDLGSGESWARTLQEVQRGWEVGLENLHSVLETGHDLRLMRRPMLGIVPNLLDDEAAKRLELPKAEGILIGDVLPGMGAEAAGLRKDDVILKLGDVDTKHGNGLVEALNHRRAGDTVEVEILRGGQPVTLPMTLSGRWMPDVPPTAPELADAVRQMYAELKAEMDALLDGVTEHEASQQPAQGEWSVKEILAHLALAERDSEYYLGTLLSGDETIAEMHNLPARINAFLAVYPTMDDARAELSRAQAQMVALIHEMPEEFVAGTATYVRFGQGMLQGAFHPRLHYDQIRAALEAVRK
jgi:uncharacterized protein YndB with AHSA1/START domain